MTTLGYIATPIHTSYEQNNSDFDRDERWARRSHKLQSRRWRKLTSKRVRLDDSIDSPRVRLSEYEFRAQRLAHG